MKKIKLTLIFVFVGLVLLATSLQALACTAIAVGKDASVDGSVMITIVQGVPSYDWQLEYVPAQDHPAGSMRPCPDYPQLNRWWDMYGKPIDADNVYKAYDQPTESGKIEIPQVPHTYAYMRCVFGVMNEHQVGFAMPTVDCRNELWNDYGKLRITQLSMIAAERAKTAREAIKIMGDLAEKYGFRGEYTPAKGLAVSDSKEAWIFHIMQVGPFWTPDSGKPGAIWAAQRVPDDEVAIFPNGFQIGKIDFDDPDHFMYCSHIKTFAEEMGWWDSQSKAPFDFREAYWGPGLLSMDEETREWIAVHFFAPSIKLPRPDEMVKMKDPDGLQYRYPFSYKPDKKVSVADLAKYMRYRGEGTPFDLTKGPLAGLWGNPNRPFGRHFTAGGEKIFQLGYGGDPGYTEILQSRNWLPNPIGGIVWWGPGLPDTGTYYPFYCGINQISEHFGGTGPETFQKYHSYKMEWGKTAFWAHSAVDLLAQTMWCYVIEDVRKLQNKTLDEAVELIPAIDKAALELYQSDPKKAEAFLTQWSNQHAEAVMGEYWDFVPYLVAKYRYGFINKPIIAQFAEGVPSIPDKEYWLKLELEYQKNERKIEPY
jgi:dipeptidase